MLHIAGAGFAVPENILSNTFLEGLHSGLSAHEIEGRYGVRNRRTCLPLGYIQETKNRSPKKAFELAGGAPTDLAVKAVEQAAACAGISIDEIGMVIGNGETSQETTPSEAQRVGKRFNLKVPAYDLSAAQATLIAQLLTLASWNFSALPKYTLLLSTAAFTTTVDYTRIEEAARFGDGAGAIIVAKKGGGRSITTSFFEGDLSADHGYTVDTYGHLSINPGAVEALDERLTTAIGRLSRTAALDWSRDVLVGDQIDLKSLERVRAAHGISESANWRILEEYGNIGGASHFAALAMNWERISSVGKIVLCSALNPGGWGGVVLGSEED